MSTTDDIIKRICSKENITLTKISKDWIYVLEKDKQIHYIVGCKFDLNNNAIATILDDKYAFYELMLHKHYPIINHHIIFKNYPKDMIKDLYEKYSRNIVIKANIGSCGKEVFRPKSLTETEELLKKLFEKNYSLSLCPFIDIKNEYRIIILDGQVELFYGKIKPTVIGDGHKTIAELLYEFNPYYFSKINYSNNKVLAKGAKFEYNWQFNLSRGANFFMDVDYNLKSRLCTLAKKVAQDIGIRFCSIDIIVDGKNDIYLMEANSGVMLENFVNIHRKGQSIVEKIYTSAINKMFLK